MEDCDLKPPAGEGCKQSEDAADRAVKKVFAILGVDINNPESVEAFREDLRFGKRMRKAVGHGQLVMVAAFVTGLCYVFVDGLVGLFRGH